MQSKFTVQYISNGGGCDGVSSTSSAPLMRTRIIRPKPIGYLQYIPTGVTGIPDRCNNFSSIQYILHFFYYLCNI